MIEHITCFHDFYSLYCYPAIEEFDKFALLALLRPEALQILAPLKIVCRGLRAGLHDGLVRYEDGCIQHSDDEIVLWAVYVVWCINSPSLFLFLASHFIKQAGDYVSLSLMISHMTIKTTWLGNRSFTPIDYRLATNQWTNEASALLSGRKNSTHISINALSDHSRNDPGTYGSHLERLHLSNLVEKLGWPVLPSGMT